MAAGLLMLTAADEARSVSPPNQPGSGPGGNNYPHGEAQRLGPFYAHGETEDQSGLYYIFQPASPAPPSAPVVLFLHGWLGNQLRAYEPWIEHIARKGYTVVWARFDAGLDPFTVLPDSAHVAWRDALSRLQGSGDHVPPAIDESGEIKTAYVGHSIGAYISTILAARARDAWNGIPIPHAIAAFTPGGFGYVPYEDLGAIDPDTRMVIVVGDEDTNVCGLTAKEIWRNTPQISASDRDFLLVKSDRHGRPRQVANHFFPGNGGFGDTATVDGRDYYVTYKLSVALLNCAFAGTDCDVALGDGNVQQLTMGEWSDGVPVTPMQWIADPVNDLQTTCTDKPPGPTPPRPDPPPPVVSPQPIVEFEQVSPRGLGTFENSGVWSMEWWKGKLYVGTVQSWYCFSQAWFTQRYPGLFNWPPVSPHRCTEDIRDLPLRAEIWCYTPETGLWEHLYKSPEIPIPGEPGFTMGRDIGYRSATAFTEPDGTEALYFGGVTANLLYEPVPPPVLLRTVDGVTFEPVPSDPGTLLGDLGTGQATFRSMTVYQDRLYVLNSDIQGKGRVLEASDPAGGNDNFRWITPEGMLVFDMEVFNGWLYLGLADLTNGYGVVKTQANGTPPYDFVTVVEPAGGKRFGRSDAVVSMEAFKDGLYVGTDRPCDVLRVNPDDTWDLLVGQGRPTQQGYKLPLSGIGTGFGYGFNYHIWRMQEHDGVLYIGTFDESTKWVIILQDRDNVPVGRRWYETLVDRAGFDLYATTDGLHFTPITTDGFGDMFDRGIRNFASSPEGLFVGGVNEVNGLMVWQGSPGGAARQPAGPPPPKGLVAELLAGSPLLTWDPSPGAVLYDIYRSDESTDYEFVRVGTTGDTFILDRMAGRFGLFDYCVVARDGSGATSQFSNMAPFPARRPSANYIGTMNSLRTWGASTQLRNELAQSGISMQRGKLNAALQQLTSVVGRIYEDSSLPAWRKEEAATLVEKLRRRVTLHQIGLLSSRQVLLGF